MQINNGIVTGNILAEANITDPEGDEIVAVYMKPQSGGTSLPKVDIAQDGTIAEIAPYNGPDLLFKIDNAGNYEMDVSGVKASTAIGVVTTVAVAIFYSDGKDVNHDPSLSADGHVNFILDINGELAPNAAPSGEAEVRASV